jgi:hypothetical protein
MPSGQNSSPARPLLLLPLAALIAVLPLILHGTSCGQDQVFHVESWLDAATQLRHLHYPHWAFTAAWNAGEPRFLFYPPLSWLLGALLTMIFPIAACPTIFLFLALLASGFTFHRLASAFASPNAALLASAFYLANPYMLLCAFERSAYAELLAAAWIPLLLLAILRPRPTVRSVAIPLALLWLTNAPAAVIGSYALALLATLRVVYALVLSARQRKPQTPSLSPTSFFLLPASLAMTYLAGTALGLALPAFYLIPAATERKYVQVAMAIIPNMRFQDNFLFTHTADAAHNAVNHTASLLALTLLILTAAALATLFLLNKTSPIQNPVILSEGHSPKSTNPETLTAVSATTLPALLTLLLVLITFLLTPLSTPVWNHLPELAFLQFPWRLLTLLAPVLALTIALLLSRFESTRAAIVLTLAVPFALSLLAYHLYAQACDPHDTPTNIALLLRTGHGLGPTDEYTPTAADNNLLRSNNPGYWLLPANANPNTPAPNTTPTPSQLNPNLDTDDTPIPVTQTLSTPAPRHLTLNLTQPSILVLNLRDYPTWQIVNERTPARPIQLQRDDGLLAIALPAGPSTIDIHWRRTPDQTLGLLLSALALIALTFTFISTRPLQLPPSARD